MKNILLLLTITFISVPILAQPRIHLGLTTAMNSTFVLDKGLSQDPRYNSTSNYEWAPIGFNFGVDFGKKFGLQLETIKAAQGQIYQIIDAYDKVVGERNIDLEYLQFPLLMRMMSGGDGTTRVNFQIGPQLSILQGGIETMNYIQSVQNIPEGVTPPAGATQNPDGTYDVPAMPLTTLLSSTAQNEIQKFKDKQIDLAIGFGIDIDIMRNFYLSLNVRSNYSLTDMRNGDLIELLKSNSLQDVVSQRANLSVGVQLGLHWMIGGTRAFKAKDKKILDEMKEENNKNSLLPKNELPRSKLTGYRGKPILKQF